MMIVESFSVTQSNTKIIHRFWQLLQPLELNIMLCINKLFQMDSIVVNVCMCGRESCGNGGSRTQVSDVAQTK